MATSSSQRLKGTLAVTVLKANNLIDGDWFNENDCYVIISTDPLSSKSKVTPRKKSIKIENCYVTQIHYGSHPVFNEKFLFEVVNGFRTFYVQVWDEDMVTDDLLGQGTFCFVNDSQGRDFDINAKNEWLYNVTIPLVTEKGKSGGTLELILHFVPQTLVDYMTKKFNGVAADFARKRLHAIAAKMAPMAVEALMGYFTND